MKTIIGIGGQKRSGKSTLAGYIKQAGAVKGLVTEEISFADPIKKLLQEVFRYEVPYSTFVDDSRKLDLVEIAPGVERTVRELLQKVGTECFRDIIHEDFWVHRGLGRINNSSANIVIIPDVRFPNELKLLKDLGKTVYVHRANFDREEDNHPSETNLIKMKEHFQEQISSPDGNIEYLQKWAEAFVRGL